MTYKKWEIILQGNVICWLIFVNIVQIQNVQIERLKNLWYFYQLKLIQIKLKDGAITKLFP